MSQPQLIIAVLASAIALTPFTTQAQTDEVHVALKNVNELVSDLEYIVLLDTKKGAKQWPNIEQLLDIFSDGFHRDHPIRMDVLLDENGQLMRFAIPVDGPRLAAGGPFLMNIAGFIGGSPRRIGKLLKIAAAGANIWIDQTKTSRVDAAGKKKSVIYGLVSEDRTALGALKPDPIPLVLPAFERGFDIVGFVNNKAAGAARRRAAIAALRKQVLPLVKKLPNESDEDFEIRKLATTHQLDELTRVYAEVQDLTVGWTTDVPKQEARLDLEVTALPGTDLETTLSELAVKPSLFGVTAKTDSSIFFGRVNHALDKMRQANIIATLILMQASANKKIAANSEYSKEKKAAVTKAVNDFMGMLQAGTEMGVFDAFIDVTLDDKQRSAVGGIKAANGTALIAILENLKAAGWKVETNVKKDEAASWHSIEFPDNKELAHALGATKVTVVTTKTAVLYATGDNASKKLTAILEKIKMPAEVDGIVVEIWAQVGPWVDYLNERRSRKDAAINMDKLSDKEKQERKESAQRRKTAESAFAGGSDTIHLKIVQKDKVLSGTTTFGQGILRFVGMMMSNFAEETL